MSHIGHKQCDKAQKRDRSRMPVKFRELLKPRARCVPSSAHSRHTVGIECLSNLPPHKPSGLIQKLQAVHQGTKTASPGLDPARWISFASIANEIVPATERKDTNPAHGMSGFVWGSTTRMLDPEAHLRLLHVPPTLSQRCQTRTVRPTQHRVSAPQQKVSRKAKQILDKKKPAFVRDPSSCRHRPGRSAALTIERKKNTQR